MQIYVVDVSVYTFMYVCTNVQMYVCDLYTVYVRMSVGVNDSSHRFTLANV